MSDQSLIKLLARIEKDLLTQKDGVFREQVADIAPHIFSVNAEAVKHQVRQQLLLKYGGARGSTTELPKTVEEVIEKEVPKFTARLYALFDPSKNRRYYQFSERNGTPEKFSVTVILKPGVKALGTRLSVFRAIRNAKQKAQRPLLRALNQSLLRIGRDQKLQASSFLDLGHETGLAFERAEQALDVIGQELSEIKTSDKSTEFQRVVQNLRRLGVQLGLSTKWPKDTKEFTVSIFLESSALNRSKGATTERQVVQRLQTELRKTIASYPNWGTQDSSDSKLTQVQKELVQEFMKFPGKVKFDDKKLLKKVNKSPTKVKGAKRKPKITPIGVSQPILNLAELQSPDQNQQNSSQELLKLKVLLDTAISTEVLRQMGPPGLINRTGRFANSVRIADVKLTRKGFPSIAYSYDKNPYQVFEVGSGRAPWATPDRDPRNIINKSIREIAKDFLIGRFFTRRV